MNTSSLHRTGFSGALLRASAAALLCSASAAWSDAPPGRGVAIQVLGGNTVQLNWQGISEAPYDVQARAGLGAGEWSTLERVAGVDGETAYTVPDDSSPSRFFRVLFPQPQAVGVEPARGPAAGGTVYLTGRFFYPGDLIRIGGVPLTDVVFLSPTLISATLPALPPGLHGVEVVSGASGGVLAVLPDAVEIGPSPERLLQGPPEWPPAGPAPSGRHRGHVTVLKAHADDDGDGIPDVLLSKKGYDYYMAQSDMASGARRGTPGHVTVLKATEQAGRLAYGHVTVLKASDQSDRLAYGHVTVLKSHADEDCDGEADLRLWSGEVCAQATDLSLPGRGLDFVWTRTYRSRLGPSSSPLGARWTHCYDASCAATADGVEVADGTGRRDLYRLQPDGTYTCPEQFREGVFTGGVFRLTFADSGFWEFRPLDASPASGKLARIQDRNGNALTLAYDGAGRLAEITDTLGRVHAVAYNADGRIASVTDSTGRAVTYAYYGGGETGGSPGDLKSATSPPVTGTPNGNDFPDGKTVTYTYTTGQADPRANHLLLTVADALGQTVLTCAYDLSAASPDFMRCVSARRGSHQKLCLSYFDETPSSGNGFAARRCLVNDAEGNVSEHAFDARNRCVRVRQYTGRAVAGLPVTDTLNRPTGKLRSDDPDFFQTGLAWNRDSLLIGGALPGGAVLSFTHEADLNPMARARKRADLRAAAQRAAPGRSADTDGDGVPDLAEITSSFTHDPRFGTDPTCPPSAPFRRSSTLLLAAASTAGPDDEPEASRRVLPTVNKRQIAEGTPVVTPARDKDKPFRFPAGTFVTAATDPRGTTATATYDAAGNLLSFIVNSHNQPEVQCAYDPYGQLTAYTHPADAAGRRRVDAFHWSQGAVTQLVVDAGAGGLQLATVFARDSRGNITRLVDPRGHDVIAAYNALGQLVAVGKQSQGVDFGQRVRVTFTYDACDNLVRVDRDNRGPDGAFDPTNPLWSVWADFDELHRPTLLAHELAHTVQQRAMTNQFVYDANDRLTLHRLPEACSGAEPDNVVAWAYDERGLLFTEERAPGTGLSTLDRCDYDADGNLRKVSKVDAFTIKQSAYTYDGFGRCVSTLDANGNLATRCFDASGNLTYERGEGETADLPGDKGNRRLAEVRYAYDLNNRLTNRVDSFFDVFTGLALGKGKIESGWSCSADGQLVSATDDSGQATTFAYDRAGRLAAATDSKGNVTSYAYDPNGNVLSVALADRSDVSAGEQLFTLSYAYDALNRCVRASDNLSNTVAYAYDACDNLVRETDPSGHETAYSYDGLGRLVRTACYDGAQARGITINTSHVEYQNARLVSTTDANSNTTSYAYDACDRVVAVTGADGTAAALVWSPRSNLARFTDANGTVVTNTYDACDRLVRRDIAPGPDVSGATTFERFFYDGLGRLTAAENDASTLTYVLDSAGNRVSSTQDGYATAATFDGLGRRRTCTCPSGRWITTEYDSLSRPSSVSLFPEEEAATALLQMSFAYDGAGRLARVTRSNGINTRLFWSGAQGTPNAAGDSGWQQVARLNHARAGGGLVVDQRNTAYDRSQNKVLRAMTAPWASGAALVTNLFAYDPLHRLARSRRTGALSAGDFDYVYDANGSRLQVTNNGVAESYAMEATLPEPADAQMNQYTVTPFGDESYDAQGSRRGRASPARSLAYHYDYAGRLVQVDELDPVGTPAPVATFLYDALGRCIGRRTYPSGGLPPVDTAYVYDDCADGRDVLETYENGALRRTHVAPHVFETKGGSNYRRTHVAPHVFETKGRIGGTPFSFDTTMFACATADGGGGVLFHHEDDLGSTLALTDASGNVVERFDYDDFGTPSFFDGAGSPQTASATGHDSLFRGLRWDAATALYFGHSQGSTVGPVKWMPPETLRTSNPLFESGGSEGSNPLFEGKHAGAQNNPYFVQSNNSGQMVESVAAGGGGSVTWHECFVCFAMDPSTGQTLGRQDAPAVRGQSDRTFAGNNPWSPQAVNGGDNPITQKRPGRAKYGNITMKRGYATVSNVLKTKHDTAKNSIGNIR